MNPSATVIILSYNQSDFILDAIESVVNQTSDDWELIVIDNGSTDNTQKLIDKYKTNPKIRLVYHPVNRNITLNCNQGVSLAKGEYISFLYADDYYLPEKLEKQLDDFSKLSEEYGVVHGPSYGVNIITNQKKMHKCINYSGNILKALLTRYHEGYINPVTPLIRKKCLEEYPFYDDLFTEGESIFFKLALSYKFHYMDEPFAVMREHDRNMRHAKKQNAKIFITTMDRLTEYPEFPSEYLSLLNILKAEILLIFGWEEIRFGIDSKWARKLFKNSIKANWKATFNPRVFIGYGLSLLPVKIRVQLNDLVDGTLRRKSVVYMDEYYK